MTMPKRMRPTRKINLRKPGKRLLIVSEGARTEPNYFKAFREDLHTILVNIEIEGIGANTDSLVEEAVRLKKQAIKDGTPYDEIWAVFDRDSFPPDHFNRAFHIADSNKIKTAYSNEAFELWFLLHFDYIDSGLSRSLYQEKLTTRLGFLYQKNDPQMYSYLRARQDDAISNAKRLFSQYTQSKPERDNPSTTVYLLVQELNKYRKQDT
jgi:hypothetical protein